MKCVVECCELHEKRTTNYAAWLLWGESHLQRTKPAVDYRKKFITFTAPRYHTQNYYCFGLSLFKSNIVRVIQVQSKQSHFWCKKFFLVFIFFEFEQHRGFIKG